jgi:hypothetical protein
MENLQTIAEQLFDVQKVQLTPTVAGFDIPQAFGIYTDKGKVLGVVGNQYTPTQPADLMSNFIECLGEGNDANLDRLTYNEMKGGSKISFAAPFKTIAFKNIRGVMDETEVSINLQTGYDGLTKTSLYLSTYRLICSNGMKANRTEFTASFKNTAGNQHKIGSICADVARSLSMFDTLEESIKHLNSVPVNQLAVKNFLRELSGTDIDKGEENSTRAINIYNEMLQSIEIEFARTGASAWGLLNGITYYTNHVASAENRQDFILLDRGEKLNRVAQELVSRM